MSGHLAAITAGAAGAVALVGIVIFFIWLCLSRKRTPTRTSETGSSDPSVQVGRNVGFELSFRETRRFEMEELSLSTKQFSDKNLIGQGKFGEVYKGLLNDGMLVAIKKRPGAPSQEFINEEKNQQFLIYEYIPNGSVSSHLYGTGQHSPEKLEFKNRVSIALGAAKGLAHLHSLSPRLIHKDFKTSNVLVVDKNFTAKVADAGLRNFLGRVDIAGPSSQVTADEIFLAPEVREFGRFSEKSDVYSFGVFLVELVSGREASESPSFDSNQNLVEWVCNCIHTILIRCSCTKVQNNQEDGTFSNIIDQRLEATFTPEGMEEVIKLIVRCVEASSERRPAMSYVVMELDRILEKEMSLTTITGEGTPTVTLGSQLFRATK
ncbi:proline-rich receptor-like protein kinase PERK1 isoform X3 [Juglans microcarpa x Juglans regia]|uniref:proline-rich receptor-like protein kinase PERK1 isoform X3 n=1 Tax=Juglans microcarpa x Juglans regia TaxID=2249226 RepID=UPI001B7F6BA7|nr:proline-rich receptor-like protein kinase PERK1 isoform X3 [Juglans microcarpa x Juglans regia]